MSSPTTIDHYVHYPICGFCMNTWDLLYQRMRMTTSPAKWLGMCKHGGCDPDIWDYINETTGWFKGWKVNRNTRLPNWAKLPDPPATNNRLYHRRENSSPNAPWRKVSNRLLGDAAKRRHRNNHEALAEFESEFLDDDEDLPDEEPVVVTVDLNDPDLW